MSMEVAGRLQSWTERRLVVRSLRQAQAAEAALRARVAKAMAQIEALNQRGRGKKRFEEVSALRQAVVTIVQRYGVEALLWLRFYQHATPRVCAHTRIDRLGSRRIVMPPSRSAGRSHPGGPRCDGWAGGCMAPINR
jgi:hypothetical protein